MFIFPFKDIEVRLPTGRTCKTIRNFYEVMIVYDKSEKPQFFFIFLIPTAHEFIFYKLKLLDLVYIMFYTKMRFPCAQTIVLINFYVLFQKSQATLESRWTRIAIAGLHYTRNKCGNIYVIKSTLPGFNIIGVYISICLRRIIKLEIIPMHHTIFVSYSCNM